MNPEEFEIVESFSVRLNYEDGDYTLVSPSTDIIMRYTNSTYDHLRLWDTEEQNMKAMFLASFMLQLLVEAGIPESEIQTKLPADVFALYQLANEDEEEDKIIFGVEDHVSDAEISYYLGEWLDGSN